MSDNESLKQLLDSNPELKGINSIPYCSPSKESKLNPVGTLFPVYPSLIASTPRSKGSEGSHTVQKV